MPFSMTKSLNKSDLFGPERPDVALIHLSVFLECWRSRRSYRTSLLSFFLKDEFPSDHKAQCQGGLWIAERDWIDIGVYWPKLPFFEKRAYRDEPYIKKLTDAVDKFNDELAALVIKCVFMFQVQ